MTWRKTLAFWVLFGLMCGYYAIFERGAAITPEPEIQRQKLLPVFGDEIAAFTLHRGNRTVRCERHDRRWQVVLPEGAAVPHDLVVALVEMLTEKQESEILDSSPKPEDLKAYGFDPPSATVEVEATDGRRMQVTVGSHNPPRTAVYVQTSFSPSVMLAGLNVEYYGDLIFDAAFPSGQKHTRS